MKMIREIRVRDLIKYLIVPALTITLIWILFAVFAHLIPYSFLKIGAIIVFALVSMLLLKPLVIGLILLYKATAPKSMRDRCRFEPTCSTYMIMAINKYGLIRGVGKGIKRIWRCRPPNGGIDYP